MNAAKSSPDCSGPPLSIVGCVDFVLGTQARVFKSVSLVVLACVVGLDVCLCCDHRGI